MFEEGLIHQAGPGEIHENPQVRMLSQNGGHAGDHPSIDLRHEPVLLRGPKELPLLASDVAQTNIDVNQSKSQKMTGG